MRYDLCDDYGVWVVSLREQNDGHWPDEYSAQEECNMRNFAAGIAKENGELLFEPDTDDPDLQFIEHHLSHPDCTCRSKTLAGKQ